MKKTYELAEGKYRLERCEQTYILWAYRNGEPWDAKKESLVGDKLVHSLLDRIDQLEESSKVNAEDCNQAEQILKSIIKEWSCSGDVFSAIQQAKEFFK